MPIVNFHPSVRSRIRRIHAELGSCEGVMRLVPEMADYPAIPEHLLQKIAKLKTLVTDAVRLSGEINFELNPVNGRLQ